MTPDEEYKLNAAILGEKLARQEAQKEVQRLEGLVVELHATLANTRETLRQCCIALEFEREQQAKAQAAPVTRERVLDVIRGYLFMGYSAEGMADAIMALLNRGAK